jgi:2-phospho-L-lactate guanylyltransferase
MDRCVFVSPCDRALQIAAEAGACALAEPGGAGGHNHAAAVGAAHAATLGARRVMMLPCDLPLLTERALDEFVAHSPHADLTLAPNQEGTGTNSVLMTAAPDLQFFFGVGSLARYIEWGMTRGWRVAVHAAPPLAFDLDTPEDYAQWPSRGEYENRIGKSVRGAGVTSAHPKNSEER